MVSQTFQSQELTVWEYSGKTCVVVGSGNSAHDICADLWEHGADVTMIQRSSTHVAKSESLMELGLSSLYSEDAVKSGITTDIADLIFASVPYKIMHTFHIPVYKAIAERDAEFTSVLRRQAFCLILAKTAQGFL